jgi:hypothetical protein
MVPVVMFLKDPELLVKNALGSNVKVTPLFIATEPPALMVTPDGFGGAEARVIAWFRHTVASNGGTDRSTQFVLVFQSPASKVWKQGKMPLIFPTTNAWLLRFPVYGSAIVDRLNHGLEPPVALAALTTYFVPL